MVLAVVGTGGAYAWLTAGSLIQLTPARGAVEGGAAGGDSAILTNLMAAQQKTAEDLAALDRAVAEEREQLTTIVGRLAELSSKMDSLQTAAVTQHTVPAVVASQPTPASQPAPAARTATAAVKPKKPARAVSQGGPISVGGAPLTPKPDTATR
jgi:hypothetical protein